MPRPAQLGTSVVNRMRNLGWLAGLGMAGILAMWSAAPVAAGEDSAVGGIIGECEVAAALGISKAGCSPPPPSRPPRFVPTPISAAPQPPPDLLKPSPQPQPRMQLEAMPETPTPAPTPAPTPTQAATPAPTPSPTPTPHREYTASFQIAFEFGSARLTSAADRILALVGKALTEPDAKGVHFRIVGHTDGIGLASYNLRLSEQRAQSVKDYLVTRHGLEPIRLQALGRGASELINRTKPGAAENRRVEITNLGN